MSFVTEIFWRSVTPADFFNIERDRAHGPAGGGGQSYISISFQGLEQKELGRFLALGNPTDLARKRPRVEIDAAVLGDETRRATLTFAPRYSLPHKDARYRIVKQNRQFQTRHPAWTESYGFPQAPDDVRKAGDPRLPDLTYLKICLIKMDDGSYAASFVNRDVRPPGAPPELGSLFHPFDASDSAGIIRLPRGSLDREQLRRILSAARAPGRSAEALEAIDRTREAAGKPPTGQGRRMDSTHRQAIEMRAMKLATDHLIDEGWKVDDVSGQSPYDLACHREGETLRVEVKGTTGDGGSVLLTPGEVRHARGYEGQLALIVASGIVLTVDETTGHVTADGGDLRLLEAWRLDDHGDLEPTGYEYHITEA